MVYDPTLGYDPSAVSSGDPFMGTASGYNPQSANSLISAANGQAQSAYQQGMLQYNNDQLAFQKAQAAFTDAMSLGSAYGYSMGGNPYNFGSMMLPSAGTPLQSTINTMGYAGAIPGVTGYDTGSTASYQQQLANQAAQAGGMTGFYSAPVQSPYSPGTFVQVPSSQLTANNYGASEALGYVRADGSIQQITSDQAKQMGMTGTPTTIGYDQYMTLAKGPPQQAPTQTLQGLQTYSGLNTAAQQNALAASQATGMYTQPGQILAPGTANNGAMFSQLDPGTQQQYMMAYGNDPNSAMAAWVKDMNAAIAQAGGGQGLTAAGTPQETMAAQNQYFNQAQQYAQTYGQYYAPSAPGQTAQAGTNAPQAGQQTLAGQQQAFSQNLQTQQFQQSAAQSYLGLLSQLQGPADYGQYLKVLGSTPSGIQGLVGAAAGNYIPGGGSSGTAPQAQTLQNLVGAATGYAGGGSGANAYGTGTSGGGGGQGNAQQYGQSSAGNLQGTASPGGMNYQNFMSAAQGLPAPNQIAPQAFGQMAPSQQQMLGSMYSNLGYAPGDINSMYQQSLPKYAAGSAAGNFKLQ